MSTRGNICIKVRKEDFGKVNEIITSYIKDEISESKPYLYIYNHHDSYPSGLGKELLNNYNNYGRALMLVLEGDCSWPGEPYTSRGEEFDHNCPKITDDYLKANEQEYLYVFKDDKWSGFDYNSNELKL